MITFITVKHLLTYPEFQNRTPADFRVDKQTGKWEVYKGNGEWTLTQYDYMSKLTLPLAANHPNGV